jgi:hypothetical protein
MVTGRRLCPIASEAESQADSWDVATSDVLYYSRRRYFPVQIVLAPLAATVLDIGFTSICLPKISQLLFPRREE